MLVAEMPELGQLSGELAAGSWVWLQSHMTAAQCAASAPVEEDGAICDTSCSRQPSSPAITTRFSKPSPRGSVSRETTQGGQHRSRSQTCHYHQCTVQILEKLVFSDRMRNTVARDVSNGMNASFTSPRRTAQDPGPLAMLDSADRTDAASFAKRTNSGRSRLLAGSSSSFLLANS